MSIIHNLVARFRADTEAFDRNVNRSRQNMTRFGTATQNLQKQLLKIAGLGGGLYVAERGFRALLSTAAKQEKAERALAAAIGQEISEFKRYASEIQKVTVYGDDEILSQMAYAKNLGITTRKLEDATTAAIGLASKYSKDLSTAMRLVALASQGETGQLKEMGIVIDQSLSKQQKYNEILKRGKDAFYLAEEAARDSTGTWKQFKNAASDASEIIGTPLLNNLTKVARAFVEMNNEIREGAELQKNMTFPFMTPPESFWDLQNRGPKPLTEEQELEKFAKKWNKSNEEFADDIQFQSEAYVEAEKIKKLYLDAVEKEIALTGRVGEARQHAAKMIEMENKLQEAGIKNTIAGKEAVNDLEKAMTRLEKVQKLGRIAEDIGNAFADAFTDMIFEAKKFQDVMNALLKDIARSVFMNTVTTPLAQSITLALDGTPATVGHSGGMVGSIGRTRNVSPMLFSGAPRLHGGLMGDEFPAILQRGEQVIPRGGAAAPTIIINNQSGQNMRQEGPTTFDGKKYVVKVVADDIQGGGTLRKLMGGLR
jgi:hypothetical protein